MSVVEFMKKKLLSILVIYSLGVLFVFTLANRVENIDNNVYVSIMAQYFPTYKAKNMDEIARKLTKQEYEEIENYLYDLDCLTRNEASRITDQILATYGR